MRDSVLTPTQCLSGRGECCETGEIEAGNKGWKVSSDKVYFKFICRIFFLPTVDRI